MCFLFLWIKFWINIILNKTKLIQKYCAKMDKINEILEEEQKIQYALNG